MKKELLLLITIISCTTIFAQDTIRLKNITKNPKSDRFKIVTDRAPQAVFIELGGENGDLILNYDRRFGKRVDGFGFKLGLGKSIDYDAGVVFNTGINFLVGNNRKGRFLEVGATQLFYTNRVEYNYWNYSYKRQINSTQFFIGYRSQPTEGGFNFRAGLIPLIINGFYGEPSLYISFGYNF